MESAAGSVSVCSSPFPQSQMEVKRVESVPSATSGRALSPVRLCATP